MKKLISLVAATILLLIVIMAFRPVKAYQEPVATSLMPSATAIRWVVDKAHTNVTFSVSHLVISDVEGKFKNVDGWVDSDKPDFSDARAGFTIDVNSISTDNDMRDNHLKSDDFFNAAKFPQIKFESTSVVPSGDNKYKLTGNLTIRDVTKPVTFDVVFGGIANAMGATHAGFKAKTTINRFDYNLKFSATTESGGMVVGKDVDITINLDLKKS